MSSSHDLKQQFSATEPGDLGIIGEPIEHSLSPLMQNAAFRTWEKVFHDQDLPTPTYHRFLVKPDQLEEAIFLMKEHQLKGLNVTIPHKVAVCRYVDTLSPFSKRVGAVNTLLFSDKKVSGFNTDADGFKAALSRDLDFDAEEKTALVLGAGGTGTVILTTLLDMLIGKIFLWNRTPDKLDQAIRNNKQASSRIIPVYSSSDVADAMKQAQLVVNATSVGLQPGEGLPVPGIKFSSQQVAFDVIYHRETDFLQEAKKSGAKAVGGLGMLIYQGARSFEIWTGTPAPIEVMRHALSPSSQGV